MGSTRAFWFLGVSALLSALGCTGAGRPRAGTDVRTQGPTADERIEELEASVARLEEYVRRMNAELGGQLDASARQLAALDAKLTAQDRWFAQLNRSLQNAGAGASSEDPMTGLPQAGATVTYLDGPEPEPGGVLYPSPASDEPRPADLPLLPAWGRQLPDSLARPGREPVVADTSNAMSSPSVTPEPVGDVGTLVPEPPADGKRLYDIAYRDLMQENYQLALINFRAYLDRYPGTRLADNAQYWLGEVYYAQGQYNVAVEEFRKVIEDYPGQDKVPSAYYKLALCFQLLDDVPTARRYLEYILETFPDSREAQLAEERLTEL